MAEPIPELTRPRRLRPGDRVAVVAPSSPVDPARLAAGIAVLQRWGLEVVTGSHVLDVHPELDYLAGTDADRARDLVSAWCDPTVSAVFCVRGGYGAQRVVPLLDWAAMRAAGPKVFVGYSDITALHEAIAARLGLVTLHGPMPAEQGFPEEPAAQEHLRRTLFEPDSVTTVTSPAAAPLVPGTASGVTLGGCLALLADSQGTPDGRRSAAGGILLVEDVGEPPYRLDRRLTQLRRAGWLDGVSGIVLGSWKECGAYAQVRPVLAERLGDLGVPVLEELGFGHGPEPFTMALGVPVTLDTDTAALVYKEPVLR
ncbi:LD-carboxypeptidase [Streptomyces sp. YIM 98790]|uniref:S66 peptidase family protein n=1 Tax=Streptomyces sp. YIM 98790 TaxID=2689077 RepID=UPI0028BDC3D7|nr:LD-carboxypeptidase [Streptomyces sp. YIM 98790]